MTLFVIDLVATLIVEKGQRGVRTWFEYLNVGVIFSFEMLRRTQQQGICTIECYQLQINGQAG
jgi:hypothetical protein